MRKLWSIVKYQHYIYVSTYMYGGICICMYVGICMCLCTYTHMGMVYVTPEAQLGWLFLNPKNKKDLSLPQIRQHICSLITEADPDTKAKVHDIRKFAASCSLQQDMLVGDLTEDFNWSSPAVFYKFYFMQTEVMQRPVSLPVRNWLLSI